MVVFNTYYFIWARYNKDFYPFCVFMLTISPRDIFIIIIIGGGGFVVNFLMTLHWGEEWATGSKLHRHQMSDSDLEISDFPKVLRPLNKTTSLYFIFSISPTRVTPHRTFLAIFLAQFISIP